MGFYAYILHCNDGSYYTGHTEDLDTRVASHQSGQIRGYTYSRRPVRLVWSQDFPTRYEALATGRQIKGWSRAKKEALIDGRWDELARLAKGRADLVLKQARDEGNGEAIEAESFRGELVEPLSRTAFRPSTGSGRTVVAVHKMVLHQLRSEAARAHPRECCGILLGHGERIERALPARNVHLAPETHFEIDPQTLVDAHRAAREGGPQVLGYYHSHPNGPAEPSATDQAMANRDGTIWVIVGRGGDVTFWRDGEGDFAPLPYSAADG